MFIDVVLFVVLLNSTDDFIAFSRCTRSFYRVTCFVFSQRLSLILLGRTEGIMMRIRGEGGVNRYNLCHIVLLVLED